MSAYMDRVIERASVKTTGVKRVISVRIKEEDYQALLTEAANAGVKPGELVRAAVETLVSQQDQ